MHYINTLLFKKLTPGLFRLLLASLVMVYHAVDFLSIGSYAVYVFFILSGYWILKMYNEKYIQYDNAYWVYLKSRLFRLLPVYYIVLAIMVVVILTSTILSERYHNVTSLPVSTLIKNVVLLDLSNVTYALITSAWSLDIEVQFYIVAPLLLVISSYKHGSFYLLALAMVGVAAALLMHYGYLRSNILVYMPYFIVGMSIYLYNVKFSTKVACWCLLIAGFILAINYIIPTLRNNYMLNKTATVLTLNYRELINILLTLLTVPFVTINIKMERVAKSDNVWSSMSYVLYLLHWPLLQLYTLSVMDVSLIQKTVHLVLYFLFTFSLSWCMSIYVDVYFEQKRKIWLSRQTQKQARSVSLTT